MSTDAAQNEAIVRFLAGAKGPVSEYDVAAGTAIGTAEVSRLLYGLMRRFECSLAVREDGTLVYDFGRTLRRLDAPTWRERLRRFGRTLWRGFCAVYRFSLAAVLVGYAVTFVVLLIAAAIAASAAAEDEGPAEGAFHLVGAIFRGIFEFTTHGALMYADVDGWGYRHRRWEPNSPVLKKKRKRKEHEKSFVASVYDFVLGPARVNVDPDAQEREVAAFVRDNRGVLTIADVQALSGMTRKQAEKFFARFVAEFDGEADITEQGALVGKFRTLLQSASKAQDAKIEYFWDEYEPPFEVTGNTAGRNLAIGLLAAFNLVGALAVVSGAAGITGAAVGLGFVPLVIFSLFFVLPLLRTPLVWRANRKQHETNVRKRLYREIFGSEDEQLRFEEIVRRANEHRSTEETLSATELRSLLEETAYEVGGTYDLDADDQLAMDADLLRREAAARREVEVEVEAEAEEVVFQT